MKGYDVEVTATIRTWVRVKADDESEARYLAEEEVHDALDRYYEVKETESEVDSYGERECEDPLFPY